MAKKLATNVHFYEIYKPLRRACYTLLGIFPIAPFFVVFVRAISTSFFIIIERINLDGAHSRGVPLPHAHG